MHRGLLFCFHNRKIAVTGQILKRDIDKRAKVPLTSADGEKTPSPAATDIRRRRARREAGAGGKQAQVGGRRRRAAATAQNTRQQISKSPSGEYGDEKSPGMRQ